MRSRDDVTKLLHAADEGGKDAADALLAVVYQELKTIAAARMRHLRPGHTLNPTALVHEAYGKLFELGEGAGAEGGPRFESRAHFFGAASQAMRDLLVDYARKKSAHKRGGGQVRAPEGALEELPIAIDMPFEDLLALDEALTRMKKEHPRKAEVVLLRYFGGLRDDEIAELLHVTTRTIEREWRFAKAWLHRELQGDEPAV